MRAVSRSAPGAQVGGQLIDRDVHGEPGRAAVVGAPLDDTVGSDQDEVGGHLAQEPFDLGTVITPLALAPGERRRGDVGQHGHIRLHGGSGR